MKFKSLATVGAAMAALLMAGNANASTWIANSSNSGGLLTGSTVLTISTVGSSNNEFTFEIQNAAGAGNTWAGATGLLAFAFNTNIIGTSGTLSATETAPNSGTGSPHSGGISNSGGGCTGGGAFFCFSWAPATVSSDMKFDVQTTGTFDYSSTNVPDLKIDFVNADGNKVGTLFSADVPFCSSNCGTVTTGGGGGGVPEPATWAMMLVGFGGLGAALRSRRKMVLTAA